MVWMKKCPKCCGDLYLESNVYGSYVECAHCPFPRDVNREALRAAQRLGRWFLGDPTELDLWKAGQQRSAEYVEV